MLCAGEALQKVAEAPHRACPSSAGTGHRVRKLDAVPNDIDAQICRLQGRVCQDLWEFLLPRRLFPEDCPDCPLFLGALLSRNRPGYSHDCGTAGSPRVSEVSVQEGAAEELCGKSTKPTSLVFSCSCATGLPSCGQNRTFCWPEPCHWSGASSPQSGVLFPLGAFSSRPADTAPAIFIRIPCWQG